MDHLQSPPKNGRHFLGLDGLRGVAALSVLILHTSSWTSGFEYLPRANLAVDFFFMLSGFVIDLAYRERLANGMPLVEFLRVRLIRLFPLIVMGALIGAVTAAVNRILDYGATWRLVATLPLAAMSLPAPYGESTYFRLNPPEWSIFFEIFANLMFGICLFRLSFNQLIYVTLTLIALYIGMAHVTGTVVHGNMAGGFAWGFLRVACPFVIGMVLNRTKHLNTHFAMPFWVAALWLLTTFVPYPDSGPWEYLIDLFITLFIYPCVIWCTQAQAGSQFGDQFAKVSGFLSYPMYILHFPILEAGMMAARLFALPKLIWVPLTIATVFLTSWSLGLLDGYVRDILLRRAAPRCRSAEPR